MQAIGRPRGGLSTKVIAAALDEDGVVSVDVAEGQRHDAQLAAPVLAEAKEAVGHVDEVLADKGFDSDEARGVIPEEAFQERERRYADLLTERPGR